ncbi:MAG TPA: DUF427 domain-containing protein [Nocardioides sp.]|uniref:DUF427 domain-containing protein n=1 Tax=Nocardioides sp. TaxID=35761 RepID=UPI002E30CF0B|nr:DUF427 domain-containing protein [Nocardioides sp.]HEX5087875.1 DUF427 domain-containing protein [Nocardioides sp.]
MTLDLDAQDRAGHGELRVRAVVKRVRALHGGETVADSTSARLVCEPRRVVASYAVPESDVRAELVPHDGEPGGSDRPVLDPRVPFTVHTAPGEALSVRLGDGTLAEGAAFRLTDPEVAGLIVLDFGAFDWLDEDEPLVSHPRDPCHRIDVCRSSRTVRIERDGGLLAESSRAMWLFEGTFGWVRHYLPREDVAVPLVIDDSRPTFCAYKGRATYWSVPGDDPVLHRIAWSYEEPLHDAEQVRGLVCFFTERLDLSIDGTPVPRMWTPWAEPD